MLQALVMRQDPSQPQLAFELCLRSHGTHSPKGTQSGSLWETPWGQRLVQGWALAASIEAVMRQDPSQPQLAFELCLRSHGMHAPKGTQSGSLWETPWGQRLVQGWALAASIETVMRQDPSLPQFAFELCLRSHGMHAPKGTQSGSLWETPWGQRLVQGWALAASIETVMRQDPSQPQLAFELCLRSHGKYAPKGTQSGSLWETPWGQRLVQGWALAASISHASGSFSASACI